MTHSCPSLPALANLRLLWFADDTASAKFGENKAAAMSGDDDAAPIRAPLSFGPTPFARYNGELITRLRARENTE